MSAHHIPIQLDGDRVTAVGAPSLQQLLAASAAVVTLEKIASSGVLPESEEQNVRVLIVRICRTFTFDSIAERVEFDNVVSLVDREMRVPA